MLHKMNLPKSVQIVIDLLAVGVVGLVVYEVFSSHEFAEMVLRVIWVIAAIVAGLLLALLFHAILWNDPGY